MISNEISNLAEFVIENGQVELSLCNVKLAETVFMILYKKSSLKNDIEKLKNDFSIETLNKVCKTINVENSTHLREYERNKICETIVNECKTYNGFVEKLKDKEYPLIDKIRGLKNVIAGKGNRVIRDNYSFATKFCHYACYYLFTDDEDRDLYPIYDSILVKYIGKSAEYKIFKNKNLNIYDNYVSVIDNIIKDKNISRNGFDHLIWLTNR